MRSARALVVLAALALARPAEGASRLAVAPVQGDRRGGLHAQLEEALCRRRSCVDTVMRGTQVQLDATRRNGADAVLVAGVRSKGAGKVLALALYTERRKPVRRWELPIGRKGLLRPDHLARLAGDVEAALGDERAAAPAARTPEPEPAPAHTSVAPPPEPSPPPAPPPSSSQLVQVSALELGVPERWPPPAPVQSRVRRPARPPAPGWIAIEAGVETTRRNLGFPAGTAPIGYTATLGGTPRLRLEVFPLAFAGEAARGLALFVDGAYQPAFELPAGARTHPATWSRLRAGIQARLPLAAWLVALPSFAYARESFEVGRADGVALPGFADARLQGVSGGLALEVAAGARVLLLAGGGATWWVEAGELAGGSRFFPGGSALGLEGEAGVSVWVGGPVSIRALAVYSTTRWSLDADPSGAYSVRSARAEAWGGRLSLRTAW